MSRERSADADSGDATMKPTIRNDSTSAAAAPNP
jgi:hypothetical protein